MSKSVTIYGGLYRNFFDGYEQIITETMVCKSCLNISSGHRQCFCTRRLKPVASSLLMVDTASLLNIQKWPLLQDSKQGLHGATTWYPTTFPLNGQKEPERQSETPDSNALWDTMKQNSKWLGVNNGLNITKTHLMPAYDA